MKAVELSKYTKEEIISALGRQFDWESEHVHDGTLDRINLYIRQQRDEKLLDKQKKTTEEWSDALSDYLTWYKNMMDKYGVDGVINATEDELARGIELETKKNLLFDVMKRIDNKVDKMMRGAYEINR